MCQLNYYEPFYRSQASSTLLLLSVDSLILSYIPVHLSILSREHQSYQRNILLLFFYISLIVCARVDFCSCMSLVNYRYSIVHTYNICILLFRRWRIRERQFCTLCPYFWTLLGVEKSRIVIIFSRLRSGPKNLLLLLCRVRGTTDICVRYHTPRAASGINEFEVPYGESASLALPMTPASGRQCSGCL